ncbi:helix-turn-helix domain-containing protein [Glycocaulis profundi]|nr:helix-turn-helix domain-containing protein [Glycocaulis profundi]
MTGEDDIRRAERAKAGSPFLNTDQAAHYIGLTGRTLANMRWRGEGPPFRKHGGRILYHIDDLETWSARSAPRPRDA